MATTTFDNLITFSRGSNATVTGPNGLIQWAPSNIATNSQDFEAASWAKNSSTITANNATAPDGTQTADTWIPTSTATAAGVRLLGTFTTVSGTVQTTSIYVKSAGKRWVYMTTPAAATNNDNCWFDLQNGVVGTIGSAAISATMTAVGNGWFRITTTSNTASPTNYIFISTTTGDNTTAVTADGTGIQVWGAQLELGSTATTYNNTSVRNLLGFSEAFDNAAWTKGGASIVTGAQANPVNGLFNAQKLMEDTSTGDHRTFQAFTVTSGTPYVFSTYVKPAGRNLVQLTSATGLVFTATFDVNAGVVTNTASGTAAITSVGSGWYRISITGTAASTASTNFQIRLVNTGTTTSYTGDGNSGVYIYGAMLSNSASLDPYVPTPGAAPSSTAYYGPRFDYDPVTLAARGLLVEEARTNLLLRSEEFDNVSWGKSNFGGAGVPVVTSNFGVSPDGTVDADRVQMTLNGGTTTSDRALLQQSVTLVAATAYTFSVWVRSLSGTVSMGIGCDNVVGNTPITVTTTWQRFTVSGTSTGTSGLAWLQLRGGQTPTQSNTADVLVWGAQLEAGAFATSYIPTIASTVTRSADVATITGSLFSQWYNQNEGGLIAEISSFGIGSNLPTFVNVSDGTTSNYIRFNGASGYLARNFVASGASTVANITVGAGLVANTPIKAAVVYANNSFNVAASGATGTEDTSGAVPVAQNQMVMGNWFTSAGTFLNGHIRSIRYVPVRAADFQLQQVTT